MSILRLIASTKTTITLLLLCACISLYTVVSTHFPIPFEIPKNILYWSFISLLGLFALNQLGTFIVRLNQSNKRSKDPFFRASTAQEENEEEALSLEKDFNQYSFDDELEASTKKGKPLPHPYPQAQESGSIETLLPLQNAESLLQVLGFKKFFKDEGENSTEKLSARKGSGQGLYTFLLHIGGMLLIVGILALLGIAPLRSIQLDIKKQSFIGGTQKTMVQKWLHQAGMSQKDSVETPKLAIEVKNLAFTKQVRFVRNKQDSKKNSFLVRLESDVLRLLDEKQEKPVWIKEIYPTLQPSASIQLKGKHKKIQKHGSLDTQNYKIVFSHIASQINISSGSTSKDIQRSKKTKIGKAQIYFEKLSKNKKDVVCAVLRIKSKKESTRECLAQGETSPSGITLTSIKNQVVLRYQLKEVYTLVHIGLVLFILGFLGFWWPARYRVFLDWKRSKNDIVIEASGVGIYPKKMVHLIEKSLYFPADWLGAPPKKKMNQAQPKPVQAQPAPSPKAQALPPVPEPPRKPQAPIQQAQQTKGPQSTQNVRQQKPVSQKPQMKQATPVAQVAPQQSTQARKAPQRVQPTPPQRTAAPAPTTQETHPNPSASQVIQPTQAAAPAVPPRQPVPLKSHPSTAQQPQTSRNSITGQQTIATPSPVPPQQAQVQAKIPNPKPPARQPQKQATAQKAARTTAKPTKTQTDGFAPIQTPRQNIQVQHPINTAPRKTRETAPQPKIKTIQPDALIPQKEEKTVVSNKKSELNLDSLFESIPKQPSNPVQQKTATSKAKDPQDFNDLDIDALFQDFDSKVGQK